MDGWPKIALPWAARFGRERVWVVALKVLGSPLTWWMTDLPFDKAKQIFSELEKGQ